MRASPRAQIRPGDELVRARWLHQTVRDTSQVNLEVQEAMAIEDGEEAQDAQRRRPAKKPSEEEVRAHRVSHLPFRDWCPGCVAGRANDWPHRSKENSREELEVPEVHFDFYFPRDADGGDYAVVLVGRDRETKTLLAHVVPHKGGDTE